MAGAGGLCVLARWLPPRAAQLGPWLRGAASVAAPAPAHPTVLASLEARGICAAKTAGIEELFGGKAARPVTVYCGFDPTARSLHVGNLAGIMALVHFWLAGHKVIALVGGATGRIGDPSGRDTERTGMSEEELQQNVAGIGATLERVLTNARQSAARALPTAATSTAPTPDGTDDTAGPGAVAEVQAMEVVNNYEWYQNLSVLDFVGGIAGRTARVATMLSKQSVRNRMEAQQEGLSFTEFSYQLFQAYDFYHLHREHGCTLQLGGSDQWGNITAGCDLVRKATGATVHGLTVPLVTTAAGVKFGKSMGNAVWLDPGMTPPSDLYQFFINVEDESLRPYLGIFTLLGPPEIDAVMREHEAAPSQRAGQRALADQVVTLVHGAAAAGEAAAAASALFGEAPIRAYTLEQLQSAFSSASVLQVPRGELEGDGLEFVELATRSGLAASRRKARTLLHGRAIQLNGERVCGDGLRLTARDVLHGRYTVLKRGKKAFWLVEWV